MNKVKKTHLLKCKTISIIFTKASMCFLSWTQKMSVTSATALIIGVLVAQGLPSGELTKATSQALFDLASVKPPPPSQNIVQRVTLSWLWSVAGWDTICLLNHHHCQQSGGPIGISQSPKPGLFISSSPSREFEPWIPSPRPLGHQFTMLTCPPLRSAIS